MNNKGSFSNILRNIRINCHNLGVEIIRSASDFIGCKDYVDISKNILEARDKFRENDIEGAVEKGRDAALDVAEKFSNGGLKVAYNGVDSLINKLTSDVYGGIAKVHNKIADYKEAKAKKDFHSGGTFNDYRKAKENANKHRDLADKNNQLGREYDGKAVESFSNAISEIPGAIGGTIFNSETIAGGAAGMLNYGIARNYLKKAENSIGKDTPKHKLTNSEKADIFANKVKDNFSDNPINRSFSINSINSSNNNGESLNRTNQFGDRNASMNMNIGSYNNDSSSDNKNKFANNDSSSDNKNKFANNDSSSNNKNKFTSNDSSSNNKNKFANNDSSSNNKNKFANNDSSSNNKNKFTSNDSSSNNKNKFANNDSALNNSNNSEDFHS